MAQLKITIETYLDGTDEKETLQLIQSLIAHDGKFKATPTKPSSRSKNVEDEDTDPDPLVINHEEKKRKKKTGKPGRKPSADTVKQAIKDFAKREGAEIAKSIVHKYGKSFSEIDTDDYKELMEELKNFDGDVTEDEDDDLEL